MGNNHDKYFGKEKRKILILGLANSGKSTILNMLTEGKTTVMKSQKTKDLNIKDAKINNLTVTFFQLAGGERQRIFWKQHYEGTQGIIFVINRQASQEDIQTSIGQLMKFNNNDTIKNIPIAISLHKMDSQIGSAQQIQKSIENQLKETTLKISVFRTNYKDKKGTQEMISWLLKLTKPL